MPSRASQVATLDGDCVEKFFYIIMNCNDSDALRSIERCNVMLFRIIR